MPSPAERSSSRGAVLGRAAVLLVLAVLAYWPAFRGGWIWDDELEVVRNPEIQHASLVDAWVHPATSDYLPIKTTVQWLEWHAWGDAPLPYHVTTFLIHVGCALLLWALLARLGLRWAWLGALLFAVHPLAVESVAWVAELKNTLSLALLLGALLLQLRHEESGRRGPAWDALALFAAALLSKGAVVMLPPVLLLLAWWRRGKISWADVRTTAPFFALAAAAAAVTIFFQQHRAIGGEVVAIGSFVERVGRGAALVVFYIHQLIWPTKLLPVYASDIFINGAFQLGAIILLLALLGVCWRWRATWGRHALLGLGVLALNLVPALGFVPMAYHRIAWAADHFAYISLAAFAGLVAAGTQMLHDHMSATARRIVLVAAASVALGWTWLSARHAAHFVSEEALWTYTLAHNPSAWIGHNNLGQRLAAAGRTAEAIPHFEAVLQQRPTDPDANYNLANALLVSGRTTEAIARYEQALRAKPDGAEIHNNLGNALLASGNLSGALTHYTAAVQASPVFAEARANLARALKRAGRTPDAETQLREAHKLAPDSATIARDLANLLADRDQTAEAISLYRAALQSAPDDAEMHNNLGTLLGEGGDLTGAVHEFETAVRLRPSYTDARENLATAQAQLAAQRGNGR